MLKTELLNIFVETVMQDFLMNKVQKKSIY